MEFYDIEYSYESDKHTQVLITKVGIVENNEDFLYYIRYNATRPEELLTINKKRIINLKIRKTVE